MNQPLVSIVMPLYNKEKYVEEAICSVLNQTYENFELIIVDDCSTDNSLDIARTYTYDNRVIILTNDVNSGVAITRNRGIDFSNGDYIAFLDSDDKWSRDNLEKQIGLLLNSGADLAYCSYDMIEEDGTFISSFIVPESISYKEMLYRSVFSCSTVVIKSDILKNKNYFNPKVYHEDFVLWVNLLGQGIKARANTDILAKYRQIKSSRSANKMMAAKERWNCYRKELNCSLVESVISFIKYCNLGIKKYYFHRK